MRYVFHHLQKQMKIFILFYRGPSEPRKQIWVWKNKIFLKDQIQDIWLYYQFITLKIA